MTEKRIRADFIPDHGQFVTPGGDAYAYTDTTGPYEYLLGALSGCLFSTFKDVIADKDVGYELVTFDVEGTKRDEVPTWLVHVLIHVTVHGCDNPQAFTSLFEEATKRCSVYQTLAHVAEMEWTIEFA